MKPAVRKKRGALGAGAVLAERQVKALLKKNAKAPESEESDGLISVDERGEDDEESGGEGEEAEEEEEEEEEEENQVAVSQRKVVVPKIISQKVQSSESKVQSSNSKVRTIFIIFIRIQFSTNSLFVYQVEVVVSAEIGPFEQLIATKNKGRATTIQRVLLPWLIAKYGLSFKYAKMDVVKQMVVAIIDEHDLLGLGMSCLEVTKTFTIGFNTIVQKAKLAAGLYMFIH